MRKEENKFIVEKKNMQRGQGNKEGGLGPCKELGQSPHLRHLLSWQNKGRQPPKCGALAL